MGTSASNDPDRENDDLATRRPRSHAPHDRFFEDGEEPPERYDQEDEFEESFDHTWKATPLVWARIARRQYWRFFIGSFWLFLVYGPLIAYGWFVCFVLAYILLEPWIFLILARRSLQQIKEGGLPAQDWKTYGSLLLLRFGTLSWEYIIWALGYSACHVLREAWLRYPWHEVAACMILAPIVLPAAAVKWRLTRFAAILIVDKRASLAEAVRVSWRIWEGRFWPLYGLELMIAAMQFVGGYFLGIGLIFLTPFTMLFWTAAYLDIIYGQAVQNKGNRSEDGETESFRAASETDALSKRAEEKS
ncbi:MAG TPA: hypothetical protein VKS79_03190 [Gemmataceae bacterium]|nr:hypothetical protein [Gemmataceae bacterium]